MKIIIRAIKRVPISYWVSKSFWKFLLEKPTSWRKFWCRAAGHPDGVRWYNSWGGEPDMRCLNCDDDLG